MESNRRVANFKFIVNHDIFQRLQEVLKSFYGSPLPLVPEGGNLEITYEQVNYIPNTSRVDSLIKILEDPAVSITHSDMNVLVEIREMLANSVESMIRLEKAIKRHEGKSANVCACGISSQDCEYHRPDNIPRVVSTDRIPLNPQPGELWTHTEWGLVVRVGTEVENSTQRHVCTVVHTGFFKRVSVGQTWRTKLRSIHWQRVSAPNSM